MGGGGWVAGRAGSSEPPEPPLDPPLKQVTVLKYICLRVKCSVCYLKLEAQNARQCGSHGLLKLATEGKNFDNGSKTRN